MPSSYVISPVLPIILGQLNFLLDFNIYYVITCTDVFIFILRFNLKSHLHFRDLSFNQLTSFPKEGLNGLNQLKLVGNFKLKEALAAKDFINLRFVFDYFAVVENRVGFHTKVCSLVTAVPKFSGRLCVCVRAHLHMCIHVCIFTYMVWVTH